MRSRRYQADQLEEAQSETLERLAHAGEFQVMKTHTTMGARALDGGKSELLQIAKQIALSHHERWDGSGYPNGLIPF
jgi:response regulator RpfG family c-di-GMP phosphodiesterase